LTFQEQGGSISPLLLFSEAFHRFLNRTRAGFVQHFHAERLKILKRFNKFLLVTLLVFGGGKREKDAYKWLLSILVTAHGFLP